MFLIFNNIKSIKKKTLIEQLFYENYSCMLGYADKQLKNKALAEDIVSTAFQRFCKKEDDLIKLESEYLNNYLYFTIDNLIKDYYRTQKHETELLNELLEKEENNSKADDYFNIINPLLLKEEYDMLWRLVDNLSEKNTVLLYYKYVLEYSDNKISEIMNIKPQNIHVYIHRAVKELRKQYEKAKEGEAYGI